MRCAATRLGEPMVGSRDPSAICCTPNAGGARGPPRSRRWADLDDASEECEEDGGTALPRLLIDDSYREAPVACLEDSKSGLNRRLARSTGLDGHPQDFTFLLESVDESAACSGFAFPPPSAVPATPPAPPAAGEQRAKDEASSREVWNFNADAPEFYPTLSMQNIPLMSVVVAAGHTPSRSMTSRASRSSHMQAQNVQAHHHTITPEKDREPSPGGTGRRRGGGKRRRASTAQSSTAQGPDLKRTKSEDRAAADDDTNAQLRAPVHTAPPAQGPVSMPNQDATEEDWLRRGEMRQKAIHIVKKFPEYTWYAETERDEQHSSPSTPDPLDRDISKRRWKYLTAQWRLALKQRFMEDGHGSTANTEDRHGSVALTDDIANTEDADDVHALEGDEFM